MLKFRRPLRTFCCWSRRMCFRLEDGILLCIRRHRKECVGLLHPLSALFLLSLIGFTFVYDLWFVLPLLTDPQGIWHKLNWLLGIYVVFNILANWWLGFTSNTTVGSLPPKRQHPEAGEAHLWHYCTTCQKLVPPRSWHCRLCNDCILKRDHHCTFLGNCVGHNNQRYFLGFLFHLTLGTGQALVYNAMLSWKHNAFLVSDPLFLVAHDYRDDPLLDWKITVGSIFKLNFLLFLVPLGMFILQMVMVSRNSTCYLIMDRSYDVGWRRNFEMVLGRRRFWTFFSATIASPLPNDGTKWICKQNV
ncbi:probable palmitoyltransferase ZDHHC24 [Drosophila ficusphila]|uniref:probable palmitoyltransferase ZDHHC24 n=1 Tax=Drosophila ficusphila TaxID=30025 RepID=UPI0007E82402|nr:probable palmitoyltransferase ZDHHC24 [Drosophila ficusphila]